MLLSNESPMNYPDNHLSYGPMAIAFYYLSY